MRQGVRTPLKRDDETHHRVRAALRLLRSHGNREKHECHQPKEVPARFRGRAQRQGSEKDGGATSSNKSVVKFSNDKHTAPWAV